MTPMEVLVRNNTEEMIKMSLSITCRDVAGENCKEGTKATVLWSGGLNEITMAVPPLQESKHCFSLYFLVLGEYTLVAAAVIDDANNILRARGQTDSPDEPILSWASVSYEYAVYIPGKALLSNRCSLPSEDVCDSLCEICVAL